MNIFKSFIIWVVAICYLVVLLPPTLILWLIVFPFDRNRTVIHWVLMYQSLILVRLIPFWNVTVEGRGKALKGTTYIIISNHQSILDILLINCLRYRFKWVSKAENTKVPVLGWYLKMADYITVDRENDESKAEMLMKSFNYLRSGMSVMLFPEGTRSPDNKVRMFRRGAFQLAIETGVHILPVMIDGTGGILPKHGLIFGTGHNITVRVLDPVPVESFDTKNVELIAEKFRSMIAAELEGLPKNIDRP
jgi:1-acyl-sn-glycerol-3-phosphate acyltransferase